MAAPGGAPGFPGTSRGVGFSAQSPEELQNQKHLQNQPCLYSTTRPLLQQNKIQGRNSQNTKREPQVPQLAPSTHGHQHSPTTAQAQPRGGPFLAGASLRANGGSETKRDFWAAWEPWYNILSFSTVLKFGSSWADLDHEAQPDRWRHQPRNIIPGCAEATRGNATGNPWWPETSENTCFY